MALIRKNSKFLFEEAKKLLTEPFACYKLMTSSLHLTLPPRSLGNARKGILDQLDFQLCLFNERLNGMLVAYDHVRIQQSFGSIMTSQPDVHFDLIAEFVVFQPESGSVLKAVVTRNEKKTIGCLIHGCFNASFHLPHYDEGSQKKEFEIGDEVVLEVVKISTTRDGLISIQSKLADPRLLKSLRGPKRSRTDMESVDSGFGTTSFVTPVSNPPKKRHRHDDDSGPSATSTPFPTSQHSFKDDNLADASFTYDSSGSVKKKHKKKKDKKEKDLNDSVSMNVSSDDVDAAALHSVEGGSTKKKKKKKDKDRDRNQTMDNSMDLFHLSMSDGSAFGSSAPESITDTEKKRKKEKRKREKMTAALVENDTCHISLEMSDCSNATIDSGLTHISGSSGKKKKHKKSDRDS